MTSGKSIPYFAWEKLPGSQFEEMTRPEGYICSEGLIEAVNVSLTLGQPLLVTGEPGTGKTQLAYSVAYNLHKHFGFGKMPLKFPVKSNTEGNDLFYSFDTLRRFHAAQSKTEDISAVNFISFNALGEAILRANEPNAIRELVPDGLPGHKEPQRSVVLIDEIDKAPREVPNDILNEIEAMEFRIPELNNKIFSADSDHRPVVIITSNSEKALPDAFLRRCVYFHIPFPDRKLLEEIISNRIGSLVAGNNVLLNDTVSLFQWVRRNEHGFRKRPGTAELLNWAQILCSRGITPDTSLKTLDPDLVLNTCYHTLFKTKEDQLKAHKPINSWLSSPAVASQP